MPDLRDSRGLCSTCNSSSDCINCLRAEGPIVYCEQFDGYAEPPDRSPAVAQAQNSDPVNTREQETFLGLCVNCDWRRACLGAKHETGVWHCEEYR